MAILNNFMKGAVKHPGIEKRAAKKAGVTTHQYLEQNKSAPGKAGQRARLGLEFEKVAAKKKKSKKAK